MGERGRGDGQVVAYSAVDSHQEGAEEARLLSTGNWLFSLGLRTLPRPCFSCEQLSLLWEPNLPENPAGREAREEWQGQRPL